MSVHILLTVIGSLTLLACFYALTRADRAADLAALEHRNAVKAVAAVRELAGRLGAVESTVETMFKQHRTLAGKFYASQAQREESTAEAAPSFQGSAAAPFCPNYGQAQLEGPRSPAAKCDCGYCAEMRHRRALEKAELLPRAAAAISARGQNGST